MDALRNFPKFGVSLLAMVVFASIATAEDRAHPQLFARLGNINKVVLLPPKIEVSQLDAGGVKERVEAWCIAAETNVTRAVQHEFAERSVRPLETLSLENSPPDVKANLDESYALLDAINASILFHTYGPPLHRFEEKVTNFDYSLGPETQDLKVGEGTALLIVQGKDHIWTGGRQALQAFGVILGLGAAVGTGSGAIPVLRGGTHLIFTLVDAQTGDLLWHGHAFRGSGYDLRSWESAQSLTREVLSTMPLLSQDIERDSDE